VSEVFNDPPNVLGLADPKLLMMAPGAHLWVASEEAFRDKVAQVRRGYALQVCVAAVAAGHAARQVAQ
jgi:hypothetical protein